MILIGKTANCLLGAYVTAHNAVLKVVDEFVPMREITRSVKVTLKCLITVVLVDDDLPYWTSKVEHLVAFATIFSNICTARAQKRWFMNFRCKFGHRRSIYRLRFPIRVQNFSDLATFFVGFYFSHFICWMSAIFLLPVCFIYWPRKYTTRVDPTSIIPTRFKVDMTIVLILRYFQLLRYSNSCSTTGCRPHRYAPVLTWLTCKARSSVDNCLAVDYELLNW